MFHLNTVFSTSSLDWLKYFLSFMDKVINKIVVISLVFPSERKYMKVGTKVLAFDAGVWGFSNS